MPVSVRYWSARMTNPWLRSRPGIPRKRRLPLDDFAQECPAVHQDNALISTPYTAADLPIDEQGRIYHLQIRPEDLAPDILLVGDPGRAQSIAASALHDLEVEHEHRGLYTATGCANHTGLRTTVTTSGMGTASLEIVLGELLALNEIDFGSRIRKASFPRLHVIRVGTSGALQAETPLGTSIITTYAVGMDNAGLLYEAPVPDGNCSRLEQEAAEVVAAGMSPGARFHHAIRPYVSRAAPSMVLALMQAARELRVPARTGLTVSNSGFFAAQGRDVCRLAPSLPHADLLWGTFNPRIGEQRVENMEMEASLLLHLLGGLGHLAGVICPVIANRRLDTFDHHYQLAVDQATQVALLALAALAPTRPA